jgi:TonB family protein
LIGLLCIQALIIFCNDMKILIFLTLLLGSSNVCVAQDDEQELKERLARADRLSNLTMPGSQPFHLKLQVADKTNAHPEFNTEIEIWWAVPGKWRREIKSSSFSQTAIQNGEHYSESNTTDYFPWWLNQIISRTLDPLPHAELTAIEPDMQGSPANRCAHWETLFSEASEKITIYNQVCFNGDGTLEHIFSRTAGASFSNYHSFGDKRIPGEIHVDAKSADGKNAKLVAHLITIDSLSEDKASFSITQDTRLAARMRFVDVAQSALQDHILNAPPMKWPPIHNFPATGMMAIDIKIDRDGNIREVGAPISANVVLSDPAVQQIKNWKFKPYLVDGSPVQVDTYLAFRFEAKVELLGSTGQSAPVLPFFQRIQKSRELSALNIPGSAPFHLHATFQYSDPTIGSCDEIWQAPTQWRREVRFGSTSVVESQNGDRTWRKILGSGFSPRQIDDFLDELDGHFPRTDGSFIEGDWGQSTVQFDGTDMVRVARGKVNANNLPISGQAYWFDSTGLLCAAYVDPRESLYAEFSEWNYKKVPRKIEVRENEVTILHITIDSIESQAALPESSFMVAGAKPQTLGGVDAYNGPAIVMPSPIFKHRPTNPPPGHGKVLVDVQIDARGHVRAAQVRSSSGSKSLDDAAIQAALQWEFTPMLIKGHPVPGHSIIEIRFND